MIMLTPIADENEFSSQFPIILEYGKAIANVENPNLCFKSGRISGRYAFLVFSDTENREVNIRIEKAGGKYTIIKYADGPVNIEKALEN